MERAEYKILLIEDNQEYAWMLELKLARSFTARYEIVQVQQLGQALASLEESIFDVILLDLTLPDSQGYASFARLSMAAPHTPIVVMTAVNDQALALQAVREGAQDYLVKGDIENSQLERALLFAIQRHRTVENLRRLSMIDELTGLLNRRGFLTLARQQLKIARRAQRELVLFYADVDGLKQINDRYGHPSGDLALQTVARLLQQTFRSSDLIARLGGDEFTVLAIDASEQKVDLICERLQRQFENYNRKGRAFPLSVSLGNARFDPNAVNLDLESLLKQADRALYKVKQRD